MVCPILHGERFIKNNLGEIGIQDLVNDNGFFLIIFPGSIGDIREMKATIVILSRNTKFQNKIRKTRAKYGIQKLSEEYKSKIINVK